MSKHVQILSLVIIGVIFCFAGLGFFTFVFNIPYGAAAAPARSVEPKTYEECTQLQESRILEMYPAVCVTSDGKSFTQNVPPVQLPD